MKLEVFERERFAAAAAARITTAVAEVLEEAGVCRLALAGGSTPLAIYRELGQVRLPSAASLDWSRVELLFGDERAVPPSDAASNYGAAIAALGEVARVARVIRMRAEESDLEAVAREYAEHVRLGLDVALLGIGEDGHTASIFPGSALFEPASNERLVAVVHGSPKPPPTRLTLTPMALSRVARLFVLANGVGKASIVARACAEGVDVRTLPIGIARSGTWLLDRDAASELPAYLYPGAPGGEDDDSDHGIGG